MCSEGSKKGDVQAPIARALEQIEKATGKQIIRILTNDLDEMEEVRCLARPEWFCRIQSTLICVFLLLANEEGVEVITP